MHQARNSNVELLRIFAIISITLYHNEVWGGYSFDIITLNKVIVDVLSMFGKVGVNLFVVISGYYSIKKSFFLKKVIQIEIETVFFSWLFLLVVILRRIILHESLLQENFIKGAIKCIFPNLFGSYWYAAAFIILCLLAPFINKLVLSLSQKQFGYLIVLLLVIWSVIPTCTMQVTSQYGFNNYLWMPIPYLIGAYYGIYPNINKFHEKKIKAITCLAIMVHCGSVIIYISM